MGLLPFRIRFLWFTWWQERERRNKGGTSGENYESTEKNQYIRQAETKQKEIVNLNLLSLIFGDPYEN